MLFPYRLHIMSYKKKSFNSFTDLIFCLLDEFKKI